MREGAGDGDWLGGRLAERGDWSEGAPAGGGWQGDAFADLADLTARDLDVAASAIDRYREISCSRCSVVPAVRSPNAVARAESTVPSTDPGPSARLRRTSADRAGSNADS